MRHSTFARVSALTLALLLILTMSVFAGVGNGKSNNGHQSFDKWLAEDYTTTAALTIHYELVAGEVTDIDIINEDDDDEYYLIEIDDNDDGMVFQVTDDMFVLDLIDPMNPDYEILDDIDLEDDILAIVEKNASFNDDDPPVTKDVLGFILNANDDDLLLSIFDSTLLDLSGDFKLDVTDDTVLWDLSDSVGTLTEEDVRNTESLAYYNDSDGTDPALLETAFILILDRTPKIERESFHNFGYKYIPLRAAARSCWYDCIWISSQEGILLVRGDTEVLIKLGDTEYVKDGQKGEFSAPPMLKNGKTFVPKEIIELLDKAGKNL